jgi:hypothetical protein
MDDFQKKLFVQLDDDSPAVREKALDAFVKSIRNARRSCRDLLREFEQGEAAQKNYAELDIKYQEALAHNAQWAQRDQMMQRQIVQLQQENATLKRRVTVFKSISWMRLNPKQAALCAVMLVAALFGYRHYTFEPWPDAADAGMHILATNAAWGEWFDKPYVATVGNKPYWVLLRGNIDTSSFSDSKGRPVAMRCLHVFAVPAEPDSGEFRRTDPYSFFGWVRWPERLVRCQLSPDQKEAQR